MEYAPIPVKFKEKADGQLEMKTEIKNDRITEESKLNKRYDNWFLTMSDFQKVILNMQHQKLVKKSQEETQQLVENRIKQNLLNLSITDIYQQMNNVFVDILNEISVLLKKKHRTVKDFILIVTKNERLFYVGIFLCIIAFCLFVIQGTSQ
jgi:hypothetical protein